MFDTFLKAAAPQIRSAFRARHDDEAVFDVLSEFFSLTQAVGTDAPVVEVVTTEHATYIKSQMPDQAFIVDTVLLTLRTLGIGYLSGFNLVLGMGRDAKGKLTCVDDPASPLESLIYVVADPTDDIEALKSALERRLRVAQSVVSGFEPMTTLLRETAHDLLAASESADDTQAEIASFLRWLLADNFVFMGLIHGNTRLGQTEKSVSKLVDVSDLDAWTISDTTVSIRKASTDSLVHRAGRLDDICIRLNDGSELKIQGLFTYRAVTQPSRHVPLLRLSLTQILAAQDCKPSSYRYKGIANVFDSLPDGVPLHNGR